MTKDVELHSSTWKTMKQALTGLTENATVSSSGYGNYTNAQAGSYSTGTASTGFAKRVEDLVKISEKVQKLIKEKDTDGVVSYTYHDETSTAQTLQAKLSTLERYAENVNTYINKKIDRPFYEAMDKVGAKLEALNIQQYKTTNKIGYKRIESVKDPYGHPVGTKEVTPPEIGIDELYKVDSPYKASLKKSYEEYKKSKDYKDSRLTETEYVQVMHQTRSFEYVSIDDEKSTTEMWRDLTLTAATVVLYVFCPPAGAVLSTVAAAAEMYSAASGKDWGTGRELDGNERATRGFFALLDLIPAGKYLSGLAKTGKTAGLTAVKTSIKTAVKEGVEQGVKNFDTFKGLLKKTKGLGDNIYHSLPTYRKQLARHLQNTVDEGLLNLSKATQEGLERAKQFTLEVPTVVVRETSTGSQIMRFEKMSKSLGDTGLGKSLDNLASKAKHVENTRLDRLRARNASKFKMYNMDDLANLQHTENFTEKSLIHIFEGDVRRRQAGGYHYDMVEGTSGSIIEGTKSPALNDAGVYEAKVEVNGIPKKGNEGYSTFFPDSMSPQEVVDAINEAYETRIFDTDSRNLYEGISKNGMKIKMYLDSEKKIISAYPSSK